MFDRLLQRLRENASLGPDSHLNIFDFKSYLLEEMGYSPYVTNILEGAVGIASSEAGRSSWLSSKIGGDYSILILILIWNLILELFVSEY